MKKFCLALLAMAATLAIAPAALADSTTYSGSALNELAYSALYTGDAQYVAGTPDVAQLLTANSGTADADDSPAVFVLGPLGALNSFSASYDLASSTGPSGTSPYWNLEVSMDGVIVNIIAMGGSTLDGSSAIHAYNADYSAAIGTWGMTLSALDALTYDGYTIGDMTVDWAGVEIGDWDNGTATIPASAEFESLTVTTPTPEPSSLLLLGTGLLGLAFLAFRKAKSSPGLTLSV